MELWERTLAAAVVTFGPICILVGWRLWLGRSKISLKTWRTKFLTAGFVAGIEAVFITAVVFAGPVLLSRQPIGPIDLRIWSGALLILALCATLFATAGAGKGRIWLLVGSLEMCVFWTLLVGGEIISQPTVVRPDKAINIQVR
jgi:hypothetical protein